MHRIIKLHRYIDHDSQMTPIDVQVTRGRSSHAALIFSWELPLAGLQGPILVPVKHRKHEYVDLCLKITPAPITSVSSSSAAKAIFAVKVKEGGMGMQIQELWQCQHWNIIPRSLVTTNNHLLRELAEAQDTSTKVNQLNWRYKQLMKNP
ncbi:hypothetical protein DPMN_187371 [Dreissena polymorpha]|uniref:Uncharacterized protein n=1 Tax=Dreissena polymorpha TaxID=45954 RepID=A0A9D4DQF5_DREPO|nr:hypothetical protein DPMN_187371 [Dreissena polymorpha]